MRWWHRDRKVKSSSKATEVHSSDALDAINRAFSARQDAEDGLIEMKGYTDYVRSERAINHFGPTIFEGMMRVRKEHS